MSANTGACFSQLLALHPLAVMIEILAVALLSSTSSTPPTLKVGVTLHPYYSWTQNIAGKLPIEVRPILPGEVDAGNYQPSPEDIAKLKDLDALVVNGLGHDDFIENMVKASGNTRLRIIRPNDGAALIRDGEGRANSHTFISFSNAITQTYWISRALGELRPQWRKQLEENATSYVKRLRSLRNNAAQQLHDAKNKRVATVHEGYSYLLQELGLELVTVVEPAHGLVPSAAELKEVVSKLKKEKVSVILSEERFPEPLLEVLKELGARVYVLSHVATGAYTADKFEKEMAANIDTLAKALVPEAP